LEAKQMQRIAGFEDLPEKVPEIVRGFVVEEENE
jgi:hypothetical protein